MSDKPFDKCRLALNELNKHVAAVDQMQTYLVVLEKTVLKAIKEGYLVGKLCMYDAPTDERIANILYDWGFFRENDEDCWVVILGEGSIVDINYLDRRGVYDVIIEEATKVWTFG